MGHYLGRTMQTVGLAAAPDVDNERRLSAWMRRYGQDMNGSATTDIIGYDRGDAVHSFNGPVAMVHSPTAAINATASRAGIYRPSMEVQDSICQNPELDPYQRLLWARMGRT